MRIAIPTDDDIYIAQHTGRCRGIAVFDIESGQASFVQTRANTFTAHHGHGHGGAGDCDHGHHGHGQHGHGALLDALSDCQFFVAHGMGPRLVNDLESRNIHVVFTGENELQRAAERFAQGQLPNEPDASTCTHPQ